MSKGKSMAQRIADMRARYGEVVTEAMTLARVNWEWLSTVSYHAPKGHKWLKVGLFEYDEDKGCYQTIVWGDMLMSKENLPENRKEKNGRPKSNNAAP